MAQFVIVAYRPKPGKESELLDLLKLHVPVLRGQGLATGRAAYVMRAANGVLVEVFECVSAEAVEAAHTNPTVLALWNQFWAVCDIETLANLPEAQRMFSPFEPVEL